MRQDFPVGIFRSSQIPVATWPTGDVFARAYVRWLEIERSGAFVLEHLHTLHHGPIRVARRAAGGQFAGRLAGRRLARRDLPRRHHRRRRPLRPLQGRRSVVPQLDRPDDGPARPADFRLSLVQQELQPLVLRPRSITAPGSVPTGKPPPCSTSSANGYSKAIARRLIPTSRRRPCRSGFAACR